MTEFSRVTGEMLTKMLEAGIPQKAALIEAEAEVARLERDLSAAQARLDVLRRRHDDDGTFTREIWRAFRGDLEAEEPQLGSQDGLQPPTPIVHRAG